MTSSLNEFRALFPIVRERTYLYSGGSAPATDPVRAVVSQWINTWISDPLRTYEELDVLMIQLRTSFAELIGATAGTVAITENTSRASNIAIRALARRPGTEVVADQATYPSSLYPWKTMTEKSVRYVKWRSPENATADVIERIGPRTAAVTVSHVDTRTGQRHQLRPLADAVHAVGGLLIVDAAQSAGVVPIDVEADGIDILTGTARKWLLGLPGVGFLYAPPGTLAQPGEIGHLSFAPDAHREPGAVPALWPDARRFEVGAPSLPGIVAARAGIDLLIDTGIASIAAHTSNVVLQCLEQLAELQLTVLTPLDAAARAGVVVIRHRDAEAIRTFLRARRVDVGFLRPDLLRVDLHGFNTLGDVDVLIDGLATFPSGSDG